MGYGFCFCLRERVERKLPIHPTRVWSWLTGNPNRWMLPCIILPMLLWVFKEGYSWYRLWNPHGRHNHQLLPAGGHTCWAWRAASWVGSSRSSRGGSRSSLTSRLISRIRCRSQAGLTPAHISCIFLFSHHGQATYISQPKTPSSAPYLTFNYKTNKMFHGRWYSALRVPLTLRISLGCICTWCNWEKN